MTHTHNTVFHSFFAVTLHNSPFLREPGDSDEEHLIHGPSSGSAVRSKGAGSSAGPPDADQQPIADSSTATTARHHRRPDCGGDEGGSYQRRRGTFAHTPTGIEKRDAVDNRPDGDLRRRRSRGRIDTCRPRISQAHSCTQPSLAWLMVKASTHLLRNEVLSFREAKVGTRPCKDDPHGGGKHGKGVRRKSARKNQGPQRHMGPRNMTSAVTFEGYCSNPQCGKWSRRLESRRGPRQEQGQRQGQKQGQARQEQWERQERQLNGVRRKLELASTAESAAASTADGGSRILRASQFWMLSQRPAQAPGGAVGTGRDDHGLRWHSIRMRSKRRRCLRLCGTSEGVQARHCRRPCERTRPRQEKAERGH